MKTAIILDPAHGKDTPGKRSPDSIHREYFWSRERINGIASKILSIECLGFDLYFPFLNIENEPGLINRVIKYNEIAFDYEKTFMLSIHNDAFGNNWSAANGSSVWTSICDNNSDIIATNLFKFLKERYPADRFRSANWLSKGELTNDPDWEADFTILAGYGEIKPLYDAVLLEWKFQTNKQDVIKMQNKELNLQFEKNMTDWIVETFKK